MQRRFDTLDVFTARRFAGNPLAVVLDAEGLDGAAMQAIAREFNLSETVFVLPPADPAHRARAAHLHAGGANCRSPGIRPSAPPCCWRRIDGGAQRRDLVLEEGVGPVRCTRRAGQCRRRARAIRPAATARTSRRSGRCRPRGGGARARTRRSRLRRFRAGTLDGRQSRSRWCRCAGSTPIGRARANLTHWEAAFGAGASQRRVPVLPRDGRGRACLSRPHVRACVRHRGGPGDRLGGRRPSPAWSRATAASRTATTALAIEQGYEMGRPSIIASVA